MRRKTLATKAIFLLALVTSLLAMSCDQMFVNYFKKAGLGQGPALSADTVATQETSTLISGNTTSTGAPTQAFIDQLAAKPEIKTAVVANLTATFTSPTATPEEKQTAAAFCAQVELKSTGADGVVNGAVNLLTSAASDPSKLSGLTSGDSTAIKDAVSQIIPPALQSDPEALKAAINSLVEANTALTALGASITDPTAALPATVDVGTAAQSAVIAAVVSAIDPSTVTIPGTTETYPDTGSLLVAVIDGTLTDLPATAVDTTALQDTFTSGSPLLNLLAAAGMDKLIPTTP